MHNGLSNSGLSDILGSLLKRLDLYGISLFLNACSIIVNAVIPHNYYTQEVKHNETQKKF